MTDERSYIVTYADHCGCDIQATMTVPELADVQEAERRHEFPAWLPECPDHRPGRP